MPKLFLYKAKDNNIIAILRRGIKRKEWQLILWNTLDDTFREGQWLINKMIHPKYCSISPDGEYFFYHYWDRCKYSEDAVFSKLPNFTAEYYGTWNTYYPNCTFTDDNKGVIVYDDQFAKRRADTELELVLRNNINVNNLSNPSYIGFRNGNKFLNANGDMVEDNMLKESYEKHASFIDMKGRVITIKDGILYANSEILLDTTNNTFKAM